MKKILLSSFGVLALLGIAYAQTTQMATSVRAIVPNLTDCAGTTVSNSAATEVSGNSGVNPTTPTAYSLYVENEDTSSSIYCNAKTTVATSGSLRGKKIFPSTSSAASWAVFNINISQKWYCITDAGSPVNVMVCKSK
jgi:hypothetical protein